MIIKLVIYKLSRANAQMKVCERSQDDITICVFDKFVIVLKNIINFISNLPFFDYPQLPHLSCYSS